MSEVQEVIVARDDGHKKRWALDRFSYFKDGPKKTLKTREAKIAVAVLFGGTALWAMVQSPAQNTSLNEPIPFKEAVVSQESLIRLPDESTRAVRQDTGRRRSQVKPLKLEGLKVQSRPKVEKIPPGLIGTARLASGASDGSVKAILLAPLNFNEEEILPGGLVLIGTGSSGEDRLAIRFQKAVFQDGTILQINAEAMDLEEKTVGLKGSKVSKYASLLAASGGLSFLAGLSEGLQEKENKNGVDVPKSDLKNGALRGVQVASIEQSKEIVSKWKESKASISVPANTEFLILFSGE